MSATAAVQSALECEDSDSRQYALCPPIPASDWALIERPFVYESRRAAESVLAGPRVYAYSLPAELSETPTHGMHHLHAVLVERYLIDESVSEWRCHLDLDRPEDRAAFLLLAALEARFRDEAESRHKALCKTPFLEAVEAVANEAEDEKRWAQKCSEEGTVYLCPLVPTPAGEPPKLVGERLYDRSGLLVRWRRHGEVCALPVAELSRNSRAECPTLRDYSWGRMEDISSLSMQDAVSVLLDEVNRRDEAGRISIGLPAILEQLEFL